jgi:hypothetical protein
MNLAKVSFTLIEAPSRIGPLIMTWRAVLAALHRRGPLVLLGLITSLLGWSFAHLFAGEPAGGDNSFHYGEVTRIVAAIRAGDWNWWNPGGNSGFASGYYYQVLPQAVPALLSAALGLSPLFCFQLGIFAPLALVPAAAYRAARIVGGTSWQALGAAIAVPCAVGGSRWGHGADGAFTVGLYTQMWALTAFPLALAHATRWLEGRRGLASALAWGLFVGLCHPFAGVALGLALFAGWAWGAISGMVLSAELSRLVALGGLLLFGAACVWLPALVDYDGFGGFPNRTADEVGPGFIELARWFFEGQIIDEGRAMSPMTALLPLVLSLSRARWLPRLWAASFMFAFLLGVGPRLPKIGDDIFPPVRFIGPLQITLAMCVGIGVAALVEQVWRKTTPGRNEAREETHALNPAARYGVLAAAAIVTALVATRGVQILRGRVKVATDMTGVARDQLGAVMDAMKAAPPGRFQVYGSAANPWSMMLPYVEAGRSAGAILGGAALQSSPNFVYHRGLEDPARVAWVFDAPLAVARPGELRLGEAIKTTKAYELRVLPAPGLVSPVQVVGELPSERDAARAAGLRWLASDLPLQNKVLERHGWGATGLPPRGRTLTVTRGDSTIRAEVEAEATTTFIVRESWHPRWRATLDGEPAPIRRVTPDYMAVDVPESNHTLELRFERPLWTWLLWLLWPGLSATAFVFERRRTKESFMSQLATP